jgi:hypothetical protein
MRVWKFLSKNAAPIQFFGLEVSGAPKMLLLLVITLVNAAEAARSRIFSGVKVCLDGVMEIEMLTLGKNLITFFR